MRRSVHCHVAHVSDLLSLELSRNHSTRTTSFPPHFSLHSPLHTLRKLPWPRTWASSTEPESLYFDTQRATNRRSNSVLRQSQLSSSLRCTTKLLPIGLLVICATCGSCVKTRKIQYLQSCGVYECGVGCGVYFLCFSRIWKTKEGSSKPLN